jgi:integrase
MITVKFYLKKPKQNKVLRVDEVSIIVKVTEVGIKGHRFELKTGEKMIPKHWDTVKQEVKSTYRGHFEINTFLLEFKTNLLKLYRDNPKIDFHKFKALAQAKPSQEKKTLFIALDQFLQQYQSEKDIKTLGKYAVMAKQLREFDKIHDIDFHTLDFKFYDSFKRHLFEIPNPNYKDCSLVPCGDSSGDFEPSHGVFASPVGLFDDTVYKYFINLKTFLAWAEKRGHQVHSSYKEWEIITRRHPPISLTLAELEKLESFEFTVESVKPFCKVGAEPSKVARACDFARDYLIFECRTGQRISDIKRFDYKDYSDFKWTFTPKKGNRISRKTNTVHFKGFCAPALLILEKHNWKMPEVSEQKINDNIKTACKIAGINQEIITYRWAQNKRIRITGPKYEFLSSHIGRKSFITIALQFMPHKLVMTLAGIDSYATLKHYEGKSEDQAIEQALEKIPTNKTLMKKAN